MFSVDVLEYLKLAPELARGDGSTRVDGLRCLERRLTHLSPRPPPPTAESLSSLFSPLAPCQIRQYPTETLLSTAARAKQKYRAPDALPSPSTKAESIAPGGHLVPIMMVSLLYVTIYRAHDASF